MAKRRRSALAWSLGDEPAAMPVRLCRYRRTARHHDRRLAPAPRPAATVTLVRPTATDAGRPFPRTQFGRRRMDAPLSLNPLGPGWMVFRGIVVAVAP